MKLKRFALVGVLSLAAAIATAGVAGAATTTPNDSAQTRPFWSSKTHQKGTPHVEKDLGRGKISPFDTAANLLQMQPQEVKAELKSGKSLNDLAAAKGWDPAKFSKDLQNAFAKNLDQAVQYGTLTKEKADAIKAKLPELTEKMLTRKGGEKPDKRAGKGGKAGRLWFKGINDQVQTLLGLDPAALKAELQSGKSLAEIAQSKGIAQADLEAKIEAAIEANLDQAVKDGKLTADQAAKIKANLPAKVKAMVTRKHTEKGQKLQQNTAPNQAQSNQA